MQIRHIRRAALAAAVLVAVIAPRSAEAQLKVAAAGVKTVTISDKVGNSQFTWTSDAPMEQIKGTADQVSGSFTFDPKNIAGLKGTVSASVTSMKTGNTTRDGHLASAAWLDAQRFPQISFTISSVSNVKVSGNTATGTANGTFVLHGISKPMAIPFKITYLDESAKTRQRAPGDLVAVLADFSISLKDFNIAGTKGVIGNKVGESITISAQLYGSTK